MKMRLSNLLTLAATAVGQAAAATTACYDHTGDLQTNWVPCNTNTTGASVCCSKNDYCLDNGLCLDAGDNNYYTQQGCTDKNFGSPCAWSCPTVTENSYATLWICSDNKNKYCCGDNATCCDSDSSDAFVDLGHFSSVHLASATDVAATVTVTATPTPASSSSSSSDNGAKIGLGVGLGVGLVVCSAAAFLAGLHMGKKRAAAAAAAQLQPQMAPMTPIVPVMGTPATPLPPTHEVKYHTQEMPGYVAGTAQGNFPQHHELAS